MKQALRLIISTQKPTLILQPTSAKKRPKYCCQSEQAFFRYLAANSFSSRNSKLSRVSTKRRSEKNFIAIDNRKTFEKHYD